MGLLQIIGRGTPPGATRYSVAGVHAYKLGQELFHESNKVVVTRIDKTESTIDVLSIDVYERWKAARQAAKEPTEVVEVPHEVEELEE